MRYSDTSRTLEYFKIDQFGPLLLSLNKWIFPFNAEPCFINPFNNDDSSSCASLLSSRPRVFQKLSWEAARLLNAVLPVHFNAPGIAVKQFPAYRFLAETSSAPVLRRILGCAKSNLGQQLFGRKFSNPRPFPAAGMQMATARRLVYVKYRR